MNVAWTGHRPDLFAEPPAAERRVQVIAAELRAAYGPGLRFHCGGQRGVDTWAAAAAERLGIALCVYLPLPIQRFTADWTTADRARLEQTWAIAAERTVVDPSGDQGAAAYRRRNGLLAEHGDFLVAVWTGLEGGGTAETIAATRRLGRPVREYLLVGAGRPPRPGERGV
jgi:hypothetical protein